MIDTLMDVMSTAGFFVQVNVQSYVQIRIAGLDSGRERGIFFSKRGSIVALVVCLDP